MTYLLATTHQDSEWGADSRKEFYYVPVRLYTNLADAIEEANRNLHIQVCQRYRPTSENAYGNQKWFDKTYPDGGGVELIVRCDYEVLTILDDGTVDMDNPAFENWSANWFHVGIQAHRDPKDPRGTAYDKINRYTQAVGPVVYG